MKVNRKGERFANESCPYNDIVFAAYNQPGHVYAQIHDSNFDEDVQRFHTLGCSALTRMMGNFMKDSMIEAGLLMEADTLEELADKMGFAGADKETFLATSAKTPAAYPPSARLRSTAAGWAPASCVPATALRSIRICRP